MSQEDKIYEYAESRLNNPNYMINEEIRESLKNLMDVPQMIGYYSREVTRIFYKMKPTDKTFEDSRDVKTRLEFFADHYKPSIRRKKILNLNGYRVNIRKMF